MWTPTGRLAEALGELAAEAVIAEQGDLMRRLPAAPHEARVVLVRGDVTAYVTETHLVWANPDGTLNGRRELIVEPDSQLMRRRVLHGWAFRQLDPATVACVRRYLKSGDPLDLEDTTYRVIRNGFYARGQR